MTISSESLEVPDIAKPHAFAAKMASVDVDKEKYLRSIMDLALAHPRQAADLNKIVFTLAGDIQNPALKAGLRVEALTGMREAIDARMPHQALGIHQQVYISAAQLSDAAKEEFQTVTLKDLWSLAKITPQPQRAGIASAIATLVNPPVLQPNIFANVRKFATAAFKI